MDARGQPNTNRLAITRPVSDNRTTSRRTQDGIAIGANRLVVAALATETAEDPSAVPGGTGVVVRRSMSNSPTASKPGTVSPSAAAVNTREATS